MRRALVPLLLASACSAAPPPPQPAPLPPPAPAVAPAPAPRLPSLELTGTVAKTKLIGHDPSGDVLYEVPLGHTYTVLGTQDGGAFAVVSEPSAANRVHTVSVLRIDARGREVWRTPIEGSGYVFRLFLVEDRLFMFDFVGENFDGKRHLRVIDAARGARLKDLDLHFSDVDGRGEVVVVADAGHVSRLGPEGDPVWSVRVRRFPSLISSVQRVDRKVAVGLDGTVLTGASDGSLVALDPEGKPLYQLGVRGAVSRIEAQASTRGPGGGFVVGTREGLVAVERGVVREIAAMAPPEGVRVKDERRDKQTREEPRKAPPWKPTVAHRARREGPSRDKPFHHVQSVVAAAPNDVWVLGQAEIGPDNDTARLYHHDGRAWSDLGVPSMVFPKEVFAEGEPARPSRFIASRLARSPSGALLVLGVRAGGAGRLSVLERVGTAFRERRELLATLAKIDIEYRTKPSYAASASGREILCNSDPAVCVEFGRGVSPRILADDEGRDMPDVAGDRVVFAGETLWRTNGWASGEADVWGLDGKELAHWNGNAFERHDSPLALRSVWAGGRDDVWLAGAEGGVARFDGARWQRILGIDGTAELSVTGSGRGDVWAFGDAGLWHVTPDPAAEPDLEGTPSPPPPAATPSLPLAVTGADPSYRLERVVLEVDGQKPLRAALHIAEGPGGVLWLHDGARVVEYDGARTRVLHQAPKPEPFYCWSAPEPDCEFCAQCTDRKPNTLGCQRCAAPTGAGEGAVLAAEGWLSIHGGRAAAEPAPLSALLAVAVAPSGAIWAVSAADDDLPHAMIKGPRGLRLVTGLPPAAYADVAVRADDDAWLAGGLTSGDSDGRTVPEGEGTLVRFDGRTFTRHRAPDGALLSVAATGPGEAWAVGTGGGVLHAKGSTVEAFHLAQEGSARLGVILRGVAAAGPNDVWMVGDGSTLLRWDGKALRRVDASAAGREAALSAVIAPGAKPGWVVGPGGIWKVVRAP